MRADGLSVSQDDLVEDRFSRLRLITWWDQNRLQSANVLVVGAGALGNEILKNLALLGFRKVLIIDGDDIEESNLSRTILFRTTDIGRPKAKVAADTFNKIGSNGLARGIKANVLSQVGIGVFGWADVILAGLDNREARLWINRCAWKTGRPWIDGAIEGINGLARVFIPGKPPCYECTLGETDWAILEKRLSCNLLTREEMLEGKTPTTPTIASIIGGLEVQEAVKLLHGLPILAGRAVIFEGLHHSTYITTYTENAECMSHFSLEKPVEFTGNSVSTTLNELYEFAQSTLGTKKVVLEFSRDIIHRLLCPNCGKADEIFAPIGTVSAAQGRCPNDGVMREVRAVHAYTGSEGFGARTIESIGLPLFDLFIARSEEREVPILISGDREEVLGNLTLSGIETPVSTDSKSKTTDLAATR